MTNNSFLELLSGFYPEKSPCLLDKENLTNLYNNAW